MTIVYDINHKCVRIYRCPIEIKLGPWIYSFDGTKNHTYKPKCKYGFQHIENGLFSSRIREDQVRFFTDDVTKCKPCTYTDYSDGRPICVEDVILFEGDLNILFTETGKLILYKQDLDYIPQRKTFKFKTLSKSARACRDRWCIPDYLMDSKWSQFYKDGFYTIEGYDFKKDTDFVVFDIDGWQVINFVPEVFNYNGEIRRDYNKTMQYLASIEPFSSANDYDVSPEERAKINAQKEKERKEAEAYRKRLERLKHTDGYCSVCGAPHASYVANPYYDDICGETRMEWLCDSCYGNTAGDI